MQLDDYIFDAVTHSELPLKAAQIAKQVKPLAGRAATPKAVAAALGALAASGRLNRIEAGKGELFTAHSFESAAAAILRSLIAAAKQAPQALKLRAKLPTALQVHFDAALSRLVDSGQAFVLPGPQRLVHAAKPKPSALLDAAKRRVLQKIFDEVNAVRGSAATLADFTAWLDAETGAEPATSGVEVSPTVLIPDAALLRAWYEQDRLRSSTMMIAIPRTFEKYAAWAQEQGGAANSQVLRNLMEGLYNDGCILLEPCERPQDLPEHERAMLVPMSLGPPGYSWCWIA